jgi:hypothetical protein
VPERSAGEFADDVPGKTSSQNYKRLWVGKSSHIFFKKTVKKFCLGIKKGLHLHPLSHKKLEDFL